MRLKIMLSVACVALALASGTAAKEAPFTLTFGWEYSQDQLARVKDWRLYSNDKETGAGWLVLTIPYDGSGASSYTAPAPLIIKGDPGGTTTRYFTMTAVGHDGTESARSNQVAHTFTIPEDVAAPFNLTIRVDLNPK